MHRATAVVAAAVAVLACVSFAAVPGCARKRTPAGSAPARSASPSPSEAASVQALDEGANAVRLQATIYELRVPPEQVAQLDAARLATADLSRPPADGSSRPLYLVDQSVNLSGDRVMVGSEEPTVTNTRLTDRGQRINTVQYNSVGAIIEFKGERVGPRQLRVTSTIEMSAKTDSGVEAAEGMPHSVMRKATMSLKGPVELGRPSVLISADASSRDKDGKAVVYVARLVLGAADGGGSPQGAR